MKLKKILVIIYFIIFISIIAVTNFFVKLMFFDQETANHIMIIALILTIVLSIINLFIINPILKIILDLQIISQKNAKGEFTTINKKAFAIEISLLVTAYNQMVNQLDEQLDQIRQSEKEKREMIANLSHDIKTPVSSLIALGQAFSDGILDESEKNYYFQAVLNNAQRIADLSDELFQIVDGEDAQLVIGKDPVWIDDSLIKVLNAFKGRISLSERDIVIESPDRLCPVYSDESAIFRILYNIIDNSLKYSKPGTPIYIVIDKESHGIKIAIKDYGQGIPEEEYEKIFKRTYRIEKSRNQFTGGHGLGLSISKKLLDQLGGEITVFSVLEEGSTFYIRIPYNREI